MIINSRLKSVLFLQEMDAALRASERSAALDPDDHEAMQRHITNRLRAGHSPADIMRPHVDRFLAASRNLHHYKIRMPDYRPDNQSRSATQARHQASALKQVRDEARTRLHTAAGFLGRPAHHFLTRADTERHEVRANHPRVYGEIWRPLSSHHQHMADLAELHHGRGTSHERHGPEHHELDRIHLTGFADPNHLQSFHDAIRHHYPGHSNVSVHDSNPVQDGRPGGSHYIQY